MTLRTAEGNIGQSIPVKRTEMESYNITKPPKHNKNIKFLKCDEKKKIEIC